jgi:hypothetical protein
MSRSSGQRDALPAALKSLVVWTYLLSVMKDIPFAFEMDNK